MIISETKLKELLNIRQKYLHDCKLCNHTGVIAHPKEDDKTWLNGKECSCVREFKRVKNLYLSNIPRAYWDKNLNDIISKETRHKVMKFIEKIDYARDNNLSLLLCGKNSGAKTLILSIILKNIVGISTRYYTFDDILNFKNIDNNELDDTNVIAIDDIGNEHRKENSDYSKKTLIGTIKNRIKVNKLTLLASKYNLEQLKGIYGDDFNNLIKNNYMIIEIENIETEKDIVQRINELLK